MSARDPSPWIGRDRRVPRTAIAVMVAWDIVVLCRSAWERHFAPEDWSSPALYRWFASHPSALAAVAAVGLFACGPFALGIAPLRSGLLMLGAMHVAFEVMTGVVGTFPPERFLTGTALTGWLVGTAFGAALSRGQRGGVSQVYADATAVAMVGGSYTLAGLSKLMRSGLHWDHNVIVHLLYGFAHVDKAGPTNPLIRAVLDAPAAGSALAVGTLVIQLGGVLMVVGPRMRRLWALLILAMHMGMALLAGLIHVPLWIFIAAFLWPWRSTEMDGAPAPPAQAEPGRFRRVSAGFVAGALALIALVWALPVDRWMASRSSNPLKPWRMERVALPEAGPSALSEADWRDLEPLHVGQRLGTWRLEGGVRAPGGGADLRWRAGGETLITWIGLDAEGRVRLGYGDITPEQRATALRLIEAVRKAAPSLPSGASWLRRSAEQR